MSIEKFKIPYPTIEDQVEDNGDSQERLPQYELDDTQKKFLGKLAIELLMQ